MDQARVEETGRGGVPCEDFDGSEMGALAHLYRGEVYRSTIWRTRLDTSTNWAVVTLGVALSISYSSPTASPLPLILVGILILLFLALEARRYRYFNVWRARARWMERNFYVPILDGTTAPNPEWRHILAEDLRHPRYHVDYLTSFARRVRRNYLWILLIQTAAYVGKLIVHPTPMESVTQFVGRANIGPVPGWIILTLGVAYCLCGVGLALWVTRADAKRHQSRRKDTPGDAMG